MPISLLHDRSFKGCLAALALVALGAGLSGCAGMSDTIAPAFADPAKYDLYKCQQLETERKTLAGRVVAELAYRNEYIALRGQSKLADEAWQKNRCVESKPEAPPPAKSAPVAKGGRAKAKRAAN